MLGTAPKYRDASRGAGDSPQLDLLDWQPVNSDLETIVRTAAAWDARLHGSD